MNLTDLSFCLYRSGKLLKGDELLIVNGQQLQGVSLEDARKLLRVPEAEVHLLVAREVSEKMQINSTHCCKTVLIVLYEMYNGLDFKFL